MLQAILLPFRRNIGILFMNFTIVLIYCGPLAHARNQTVHCVDFLTCSAPLRLFFANELLRDLWDAVLRPAQPTVVGAQARQL